MSKEYPRMTGIGDEGSAGIADQIENHKSLGWNTIELRNVDGKNICEMPEEQFDDVCGAMEKAGLKAAGFASAIANWARPISSPFSRDTDDLKRAIPRMRRLGTKYIRIMSYPNDGLGAAAWKAEVFTRIRELVRIAEGEGIILLHENCDGWASQNPENLRELLGLINSPSLKIVFDPGNPVSHGSSTRTVRDFYNAALPFIEHFHIKDCKIKTGSAGAIHTYPGEGDCDVAAIMEDLMGRGYKGMFSIEPHMATQVHLGGKAAEGVDQRGIFLEYGKRANALFDEVSGKKS